MTAPQDLAEELDRLRAVQRAIVRLASEEPPLDAQGAFTSWGVHPDDAAALGSFSPERTGVYAGLVGGTVLAAVKNQLPATAARIDAGALKTMVQRFLAERAPRSPYLRDVPFEFTMWISPQWPLDRGVPAFLPDLARHELLLFAAGTAERGPQPAAAEALSADRGVWLDGSVHLACFNHAVHLLPDDPSDRTDPRPGETALLVYRDVDNEVQTMVLTPSAMETLERLAAGAPLGRAIMDAAAAMDCKVDGPWIEGISSLLSDLAGRGALLGPAPPGEARPLVNDSSPYRRWLLRGEP